MHRPLLAIFAVADRSNSWLAATDAMRTLPSWTSVPRNSIADALGEPWGRGAASSGDAVASTHDFDRSDRRLGRQGPHAFRRHATPCEGVVGFTPYTGELDCPAPAALQFAL